MVFTADIAEVYPGGKFTACFPKQFVFTGKHVFIGQNIHFAPGHVVNTYTHIFIFSEAETDIGFTGEWIWINILNLTII